MSDQITELKNKWQSAKESTSQSTSFDEIIELSKKKMKSAVNAQIGNILVLTITLLGLLAFFKYVAPFQETISKVGTSLMVGGLIMRILIELYSIYRSSKINMGHSASNYSDASLQYYQFRRRIHGPVMALILVSYTVGFYLLNPEFSLYLSFEMMIFINVGYLVGAVIVGYSIRKAIRHEMDHLKELLDLQHDMKKRYED